MNLNIEDFESTSEEENIDLSIITSKKICQIIISCRYLKINNDLHILCMKELSNRRLNGEVFDFESYIDENMKSLPELNFSIPNFKDLLNQAIKK